MDHRNDIPWTRLMAEGVAIVASILLAFGIDAWWDDRQERQEEQQILKGLREEFLTIRNVLVRDLEEHLGYLEVLEDFLGATEAGDPDLPTKIEYVLVELLSPGTTDLGHGTLNALLNSGGINILESSSLRARLADWPGIIGEVWDDQANNSRIALEFHVPYFVDRQVPAGSAMRHWYDVWDVPVRSIGEDPELMSRLLADPGFRTLVEMRYGYKRHLTGEFEAAITAVDAILTEIDASLTP